MKRKLFIVLTLILALLMLVSCAIPTDYEDFHAKAIEASETAPGYTSVKVEGEFCFEGEVEEISETLEVVNGYVEIDTKTPLTLNVNLKYTLEARAYMSSVINRKAYTIGKDMVSYKVGNGFETDWSKTVGQSKQTAEYSFDEYGWCVYEKETIGDSYAELILKWS